MRGLRWTPTVAIVLISSSLAVIGNSLSIKALQKIGVRNAHALAYDSTRGRVVLFGGADASKVRGDTWEWDGNSWSQVSSAGPAPQRFQ